MEDFTSCHKAGFSSVLDFGTQDVSCGTTAVQSTLQKGHIMIRTLVLLHVGIALGAGGATFANLHEDDESVRVIATQDIDEKLDGKDAKMTFVEVTLEPGKSGVPHRHPGPGFVYVLEGKYELGINDQPTKIYKAGEVFYEPTGCLHRVSKNPAKEGRTRLIAVVLHPRDAKEIAVPEKGVEQRR